MPYISLGSRRTRRELFLTSTIKTPQVTNISINFCYFPPPPNIIPTKMILMAEDSWLQQIRPALEKELKGIASLTQAVTGMLEVLPFGSSKGDGVSKLLEHLGISVDHTAAFGDGENDVEMFEVVKYGIAVANAKPELQAAARYITESNADNGVANAIQKIIKAKEGERSEEL